MRIMQATVPGERPEDFVELVDARGRSHVFASYPLMARMAPMVGTFAFARRRSDGAEPLVLYVSTVPNVRAEVEDPLLRSLARAHGATHVLVHCRTLGGAAGPDLEASLVAAYRPVMNGAPDTEPVEPDLFARRDQPRRSARF